MAATSVEPFIKETNTNSDSKLESDEFLSSVDLICEGPIEGLVDSEGNVLKYLPNKDYSNIVLGKGVYYNNVPLIDSKLNKFNFVTQGFGIFYGAENNEGFYDYPSTVFNYKQKILLNEKNFATGSTQLNSFSRNNLLTRTCYIVFYGGSVQEFNFLDDNGGADPTDMELIKPWLTNIQSAKNYCNPFIHEIKNNFCDEISVNISVDQLFNIDTNGNTVSSTLNFVVEFFEDDTDFSTYVTSYVSGISKSNYTFQIFFNLELDPFVQRKRYIRVYPLTRKISYTNAKTAISFGVSSIVESVKKKGEFYYPYSAVVKSSVSSNHFKNDPDRSFDLKLLKIKVPSNYDPEAKTYSGNWNGSFSSFLRWTDNPAWIFYDICTNSRYGVGNGKIFLEDLNKWELYKIAKYCDELVISTAPRGASEDNFTYYPEDYPSQIFLRKDSKSGILYSLQEIKEKYKPVYSVTYNDNTKKYDQYDSKNYNNSNGGPCNSLIFLFDINEESVKNSIKVVSTIIEGTMVASEQDQNKFEFKETKENQGNVFSFRLMPYVGPTLAFEKEETGNMLASFKQKMVSDDVLKNDKRVKTLEDLLSNSKINTENGAKNHIYDFIVNNWSNYPQLGRDYIYDKVFKEYSSNNVLYGKCLPRVLGYRDPLEPRFRANVLINNETECLKLLNDLSSIFRGLTYYRNNLITTTVDVSKPISYLFNNTSVKDGVFTYSTGSLDGNYSVAKVLYKDSFNKFEDEVEIVEDSDLIREYGIVTKEILGFGVTSRDQARRMGLWLLATNRFENQTVTFTTDMQGIILKPGDVIQIEDSFRNDYLLQGRVVSVNRDEKYIVVDRKIDVRFAGSKIKFLCDKNYDSFKDISSSDQFESQQRSDVIDLFIERIENNTNRIYINQPLDDDGNLDEESFSNFYKISQSSPFIVQADFISNQIAGEVNEEELENFSDNKNLYKIVSIAEQDVNEYSIFAIKYDKNKYSSLDKNIIDSGSGNSKNTINYSSSENLAELDLVGMSSSYYQLDRKNINQVSQLSFDYSFSEYESTLSDDKPSNYAVLTLKFDDIKNYIETQSAAGSEYYSKVDQVLSLGGGFVCKVISENQSIKFKVSILDVGEKTIFLGKFPKGVTNIISSASSIKIYIYDVENKIIEV